MYFKVSLSYLSASYVCSMLLVGLRVQIQAHELGHLYKQVMELLILPCDALLGQDLDS